LIAIAFATEIDTVTIAVGEQTEGSKEHFSVFIDRLEKEYDDNQKLIAARDIEILLKFDVDENLNVLVNGNEVALGFSEIQIQAQVSEIEEEGVKSPFEVLLVSLRLFAKVEEFANADGSKASVATIQQRVVGIEGKKVWQAYVLEQSILVNANGQIQKQDVVQIQAMEGEIQDEINDDDDDEINDEINDDDEKDEKEHHKGEHHKGEHHKDDDEKDEKEHKGEHHKGEHHKGEHHKDDEKEHKENDDEKEHENQGKPEHQEIDDHFFQNKPRETICHKFFSWFHSLSFPLRVLVSFGIGIAFGLFVVCLLSCCISCFRKKSSYKDNLKMYSAQYTSLPQDEKKT